MSLPNFLIVGAAKSGTTSLFDYLGQHPDVYTPPCKEPSYFSDGQPVMARTDLEYEAIFRGHGGERAIGEASTSYLYDPAAPRRIRKLLGDVAILIVLRNPARRAYSAWAHNVMQLAHEPLEFEQALAAEDDRVASQAFRESCPFYYGCYHYYRCGLYYDQVKRYLDTFGADRVRVFLFEEFVRDPATTCRDAFSLLGVDTAFVPSFEKRNVAPAFRSRWLVTLLTRPPSLVRRTYESLPLRMRLAAYRIVRYIHHKNLEHQPRPPMVDGVEAKLMTRYREDITRLESLLGRDLKVWYDEADAPRSLPAAAGGISKAEIQRPAASNEDNAHFEHAGS